MESDASGHSPGPKVTPMDICSTGTTVVTALALVVLIMIAQWIPATRSGNFEKARFITYRFWRAHGCLGYTVSLLEETAIQRADIGFCLLIGVEGGVPRVSWFHFLLRNLKCKSRN